MANRITEKNQASSREQSPRGRRGNGNPGGGEGLCAALYALFTHWTRLCSLRGSPSSPSFSPPSPSTHTQPDASQQPIRGQNSTSALTSF
ncbi:hypothetical protein PBY51_006491 [Eleginops maclovinus]|uniref:Uncharacterized protein n=1 Tax=Eleginops maclovinus TaxID=56733 RepID=A0AAN7X261_ELEMC|nr:hypothetical protein PBY51_006491 [Eleginops maclovinus]